MKEKKFRLMVVDDEEDICSALEFLLRNEGYAVDTASGGEGALQLLEKKDYDLVLTDVKMDGMSGVELLEHVKSINQTVPVMVMTAYASVEGAVEAMKKGASDYIVKPFINEEVKITVRRILEHHQLERENQSLRRQLSNRLDNSDFLGDSPSVRELLSMIERVAPTRSNVLLLGESGTGKSLVAEMIHANSPCRNRPLISINCSAIPETLLESELFGYKKGAFTGANSDKIGLIEAADGGTLFLDEIGDMPLALQAKLLKVIDTGEVLPLGAIRPKNVDVRIIAATNKHLEDAVRDCQFREDLYYRLDVIRLVIPPLRERKEDIPLLASWFVSRSSIRHDKHVDGIDRRALDLLTAYDWPGNVRELQNVLERSVVLCSAQSIMPEDLPEKLSGSDIPSTGASLKETLDLHERAIILGRLKEFEWDKEKTASSFNIDLATLYRKMKKFDINGGKGSH
jgi:DNA-binding NtrC family response regulator